MWVAPLSTSIVRVKSPEQRLAADRAAFIAMKAPKTPSGKRRFCGDGSEGTGPSWIVGVAEAAGLGDNSARDDPEVVEDAAASTREAPIALNENPKVGGSG